MYLVPYTAKDRALFKGRDTDIERIARQLGEQSQLVVHGQAGMGKTWLLSAWVIATLMESRANE